MMISGFLSVQSLKLRFGKFLWKKVKQILLPGFAWESLFSIICVVVWKEGIPIHKNFSEYIPFWFLWALFSCYLLAYMGNLFQHGRIITLFFSQLIPIWNVIYMYPAFVLGMVISENREWFKANAKFVLITTVFIYSIAMGFWGENDWHLANQTKDRIITCGYVSASFFYIWKTIYKILVNLSGSIMLFSFFSIAEPYFNNRYMKWLGFVGKYTLIVYILQCYIIEQKMALFLKFDNLNMALFNFVITPVVSLCVLFVSLTIAALIDTNRYTRFLFLGR